MPLPTAPAGRPGGSLPVATPQQAAAQNLQQDRMAQQFRLRMAIADNLKRIKHTVIVMSGKGGVGKTTVSVNIAAAFAAKGWKVGLLDLDLTNPNVPIMLGLTLAKPGGQSEDIKPVLVPAPSGEGSLKVMSTEFFLTTKNDAIIWRGPIKMNVINQLLGNVDWGELDLLVVDLPPGTGDEPLTIAQLLKDADGVVLVTTPQQVAVQDVAKSLQFVRSMDLTPLGVIENMSSFVCPDCSSVHHVFGKDGGRDLAQKSGIPLLGSIPLEPAVQQAGDAGTPFVWRAVESATGRAFQDAMGNVAKQLKKKD